MRLKLQALFCSFLVVTSTASVAHAQYPNKNPDRTGPASSQSLTRLQSKGPGHAAVVTMSDGTLRGGWIKGVDDSQLHLQKQGGDVSLPLSDVTLVQIKRSDRTLLYTALGYLVTATVATVIAHSDGEHDFKDQVIIFGVGGIPGGVLGALIGHWTSGDIEIVP